jgi:5-methylcytosine-specific restriction protein A
MLQYIQSIHAFEERARIKPSGVSVRALFLCAEREGHRMKPWAERFYNSDAWRECRNGFLKSKGYLCERCSTPSNPVVAKIAHHKIYLTRQNINDPYITLSWDNLEALCQECHNKEHHVSQRRKRYAFDEQGNLVSPPIRRTDREGSTPRAGG